MLSPLRNRFGIPGVISVIALVFAMLGGAYAASDNGGSNSATASAKKKAKKGPRGPRGPKGPAGPAGAQGPAGPAGAKGDKGDAGSNGSNGQGAEVASFAGSKGPIGGVTCTAGGLEVKSASGTTLVCNGKAGSAGAPGAQGPPGSPWTLGGTIPSGESLKGNWSLTEVSSAGSDSYSLESISFGLEYPGEPPTLVYVDGAGVETVLANEKEGEVSDRCPSANANAPSAAKGYLCLYQLFTISPSPADDFVPEPPPGEPGTDATKVGATLMTFEKPALATGTWAVTAP